MYRSARTFEKEVLFVIFIILSHISERFRRDTDEEQRQQQRWERRLRWLDEERRRGSVGIVVGQRDGGARLSAALRDWVSDVGAIA